MKMSKSWAEYSLLEDFRLLGLDSRVYERIRQITHPGYKHTQQFGIELRAAAAS